jgi:hypothetical protein
MIANNKLGFNQCYGSGIFIPDPDPEFYPSRISDPGSNKNNKRGGRKISLTFIQGMPIRISSKQMKKLINFTFFKKFENALKNAKKYDTFDTIEKDYTL